MRLIDADALIDKYGDYYTEEGTEEGYIGTIKGIVDSMPTIEPERKQMKIEYTEWNEELWGASAICGNCGCTWQIANNGEDNYCPNCGCKMER